MPAFFSLLVDKVAQDVDISFVVSTVGMVVITFLRSAAGNGTTLPRAQECSAGRVCADRTLRAHRATKADGALGAGRSASTVTQQGIETVLHPADGFNGFTEGNVLGSLVW